MRARRAKLHYFPQTDSLHIQLKPGLDTGMSKVADELIADLDVDGAVVGFDIDHASMTLDVGTLPLKAA